MKTEIEIPVAELKSILPGLARITGRSRTLPVLQCIKVRSGDDFIDLQAHNLDEVATVRLPNQTKGVPGELLMPIEALSKIVKGCAPEQSVRLIASATETKIRCSVAGNSVDRVVERVPPADWPAVKVVEQESFPLDDAFKQSLKEAMECASEDPSRHVLRGACLDVLNKDAHYVVGTDGRHLYSANSFQFHLPESLILPTCKFVVWPGFVNDGPWRLRMLPAVKVDPQDKKADKSKEEPAWFQIESDRWTYLARGIEGQYPHWKQVVPEVTSNWSLIILAPASVQMMQQAIPLIPGADSQNETIILEDAGGKLWLSGQGRDDKEATRMEVPEAQVTGKPFRVALNRTYLLQAVRFGLHDIRINDSLSPLVCSNLKKTMIIMPVRLEGPAGPVPTNEPPGAPDNSPTENAEAAMPSAAAAENQTKEKETMSTTTTTTPPPKPARVNGEAEETRCSFKAALEHIDRIKTNLRDVISDLSDAVALLKAAEKEQRATSKEIDAIRSKLREIQSVKL